MEKRTCNNKTQDKSVISLNRNCSKKWNEQEVKQTNKNPKDFGAAHTIRGGRSASESTKTRITADDKCLFRKCTIIERAVYAQNHSWNFEALSSSNGPRPLPQQETKFTFGCWVMLLSSTVDTTNSHDNESTDMLFCRAHVWRTAVRKPVGKVKPDIQNMTGWWAVVAHLANCSTRRTRSRVQLPNGLLEG